MFYSLSHKLKECGEDSERVRKVREMRNRFMERGTQKEAAEFFEKEVTIRCFFWDFTMGMEHAGREIHLREKHKIVKGFRKLVSRLHQSPSFLEHLRTLKEEGFEMPSLFAPRS